MSKTKTAGNSHYELLYIISNKFTEDEVKQIVLEFVQRTLTPKLNSVRISNYSADYCVITVQEPEEPETTTE